MTKNRKINLNEAISAYSHIGAAESARPFGSGHINDTFIVTANGKRYTLQRINHGVFKDPIRVIENISRVTSHIRKKVAEVGGDVEHSSLALIKTNDGKVAFNDSDGYFWRMYSFVEDTISRDSVESVHDFYSCAEAFGRFQGYLADFPADELYECIKDFHNTPVRYDNLMKAVEKDICGRAESVKDEIAFAIERKDFCATLLNAEKEGKLPLRVTHNDTKLNNILFDEISGEAVCVIDLDTVMPGYSVNDFGDAIRFGANTAAEDETDLSKISLDLELFRAYAEGFIKGCGGRLTDVEIDLLPIGAIMMTLECGMRFLTDYLEGDVYFKTHREGHNLDRARNQFALVKDMEAKLAQMNEIISEF